MYNPFKPHIATNGEVYCVRKLSIIGWMLFDLRTYDNWWYKYGTPYKYGTLEQAKTALQQAKKALQRVNFYAYLPRN